jgi:hypothetical protein
VAASAAKGDEFYYVMIFGSQSKPKLLQYTHTWATFIRAIGDLRRESWRSRAGL